MNTLSDKARELIEACDLAHKEICGLANGSRKWTMSIPVQAYDSDMTLQRPLDLAADIAKGYLELEQENLRLKVEAARPYDKLIVALSQIGKVKYGLELHDYENMEYVADYWATRVMQYEDIARKALAEVQK